MSCSKGVAASTSPMTYLATGQARRTRARHGGGVVMSDRSGQHSATAQPETGWNDRSMAVARERWALVTGSSRGLGAAIARRLARDGLAVAVNGRRGDGLAGDVARRIRDAEGGAAEAFGADVTDDQQAAELVAAITGRLGPVDVLVLNATGPQPEGPVT